MELQKAIHKATLLVDLKNDFDAAIDLLIKSIALADSNLQTVDFIKAKIFLAELFFEQNKKETTEKLLHEAVELSNSSENIEVDLIEPDILRAKFLLEKIRKKL